MSFTRKLIFPGPRVKRPKKPPSDSSLKSEDEKRPRTAFSGPQLARLKVIIKKSLSNNCNYNYNN